ncbi:MAG: hypothetical protein V4503_10175 [Gemmatimonadota bacterium]
MSFPMVRRAPMLGALLSLAALAATQSPLAAQEKVDLATIEKIKAEAMGHSQVMDIMSWLTDVYGPRLTWSPNLTKAGNWAAKTMTGWGLANVHLEPWSTPAGLGWANERFSFQSVAPNPFIIQAVPRAWSAGTKGKVTGPAMIVEAGCFAELRQKYAGKLKGAFVMATHADTNPVTEFNAWASRLKELRIPNSGPVGAAACRRSAGRTWQFRWWRSRCPGTVGRVSG